MLEGIPSIWPYFLIISVAFCIALFWINKRAIQKELSIATAMDVSLAVMIFGFLGARAFHVIFEAPDLYRESPVQILRVWEGGFVWYGGAVAGIFAGLWLLSKRSEPFGPWLDLFAPVGAFGYSFGRIACWMQGCCFGRFCEISGRHFQFPTQAFAVFWEASVVLVLLFIEARTKTSDRFTTFKGPGALFCLWLILHGVGRFIMELFRGDDRGPVFGGVSIAMFISAALISTGIFYIQRLNSRT